MCLAMNGCAPKRKPPPCVTAQDGGETRKDLDMQTLSKPEHRRKRQVQAAFARDGFRRVRADIVRDFFIEHPIAYLDQYHFCVKWSGLGWRILPDWRRRLDWDHFQREQLKGFSDRQVELALLDLEALGVVEFSRIENQIIVRRTAAGAQAWAA